MRTYLRYHKHTDAVLNKKGETALQILVSRKETVLAKQILRKNADPNISEIDGRTALHRAVAEGSQVMVQCLLKYGANINAQCKDGLTPLHYACMSTRGNGCISALLNHQCHPNIEDKEGRTPLFYILRNPYASVKILERLLDSGCKLKESAKSIKPLHMLAKESIFGKQAAEYAQALIDRGADVNERDSRLCTPLHIAARFGSHDFISCICDNGANEYLLNDTLHTPLSIALFWNQGKSAVEIVKRIALTRFLTGYVENDCLSLIELTPNLYSLYTSYLSELRALSKTNGPVSYLDIYLADRKTLIEYTRNHRIVQLVKRLESTNFPNFGVRARQRFNAVLERMDALAFCEDFLVHVFDGRLPHLCAKNMAAYITTKDIWKWQNMIED